VSDESLRKAYKYKLRPTPEQARQLEQTLWRCRTLYNTALEERITAYRRCGVTLTCYQQQAELPDLKAAFPEYGDIHSQVLQDVLARLDTTYQAFFRRIKAGQTPGFPRFQGRNRYHSFTYKQYGNGARLYHGGMDGGGGRDGWPGCLGAGGLLRGGAGDDRAGGAAAMDEDASAGREQPTERASPGLNGRASVLP
jgi:transposase